MDPVTGPGDIRPGHLGRAPGERYLDATPVIRERPDMVRALILGAFAGILVAIGAGLLRSVLDLTAGLLALAVAGGWVVGAAVRRGAWAGLPHRASAAPEVLGLLLGAATWVAGLVMAWVVAMAILPGSERSLLERLGGTPFLDWLAPQLGLADVLGAVLAAVLGWLGARSAAASPTS
ncbi:MAG: hypothetical protein ABWZ82_01100 [Candidatus Limnocylindrales bacterium]